MNTLAELKTQVKEHWERESCGARYGAGFDDRRKFFDEIERTRYEQDYMLKAFAQFDAARGKRVLEVGLGTGTDFVQWCRAGADAYGRDLTEAAVGYVKERLDLEGLQANVTTGDAEKLEFPDNYFDIYYSWGVLHHTSNPEKAFAEAYRVLKPGGTLKLMLYHHTSVSTFLVWLLYGPLRLNFKSARHCVFHNVESIGTKVYTRQEVREQLGKYFGPKRLNIHTYLGSGDLLTQIPSTKYQSAIWEIIFKLYPRWFVKTFIGHRFGFVMTIEAVKP